MKGVRLQSCRLKPAEPFTDCSLGHRDRQAPRQLFTQIDTAPAENLIFRWIEALNDHSLQLRHLFFVQFDAEFALAPAPR